MKRYHLFFVALVATMAAMAFGAHTALAENANLNFNPQTGELVYQTYSAGGTDNNNKVILSKAPFSGTTVEITDTSWFFNSLLNPNGGRLYVNDDVKKSCLFVDGGTYWRVSWACPATKVTIKTNAGDDMITVHQDVKLPTVLEGGAGSDIIQGGGGKDVIWGGCSNNSACDTTANSLHGGDGDDVLHGGDSASYDYLAGDAGDDRLDGGLGRDNLYGGDGRDLADYSSRTVPIVAWLDGVANDGQAGENDFIADDVEGIQGGSGKDTLYAGFLKSSILRGGPGDDTLVGYAGNDLLMGEGGNDTLRPGFGTDNVYGGSERDTVTYEERLNPVTVTLDGAGNDGEAGENDFVASDVENVTGGKNNDTLIGDGQANKLIGGPGDDTLSGMGGSGADHLLGEAGSDKLDGGPAGSYYDVLDGGGDTDTVSYASRTDGVQIQLGVKSGAGDQDTIVNVENAVGGAGDDKIVGTDGPNALFGGGGNDGIQGNGGNDTLNGGDGNDTLWGNAGKDTIAAGDGADIMSGGEGPDWFSGWTGVDTVTYDDHSVPVTITLDGTANDGAAGEGDNVLPGNETIVGGSAGDTITGTSEPETLIGGGGADTLFGMGAADQLTGGAGADTLNGGDGPDTLEGGTENDKLYGDAGYDRLRGGPGGDQLHGGADGDYADYSQASSAVTVDLAAKTGSGEGSDTFDSIENVYGSKYNDTLKGDVGPNTISGFGGNDSIVGSGGADHLFGADGNDLLRGDDGNDELDGGAGSDTATYANAPAAVVVDLSFYNASATGGAGTDWLKLIENVTGSGLPDQITGSVEANVLLGGGGNDTLLGLGGNDKLDGQAGVDSVDGGTEIDTCLAETKANCEK